MTLVSICRKLARDANQLTFEEPVSYVYNPLTYAWDPHRQYLERFGRGPKEAILIGMNPGPYGMTQTGVPFGEIASVRDWMGIEGRVKRPDPEHPKREVLGFECPRSEVSGRRLWGWAADRFGEPEQFFERFFVYNYCPLTFMEESGRNRTPDKLPPHERDPLFELCDEALRKIVGVLQPRIVVGIGAFAEARARRALEDGADVSFGRLLHPSPASPIANRGWDKEADKCLKKLGLLGS